MKTFKYNQSIQWSFNENQSNLVDFQITSFEFDRCSIESEKLVGMSVRPFVHLSVRKFNIIFSNPHSE